MQRTSSLSESWKGEDYLRLSNEPGGLVLVAEVLAGSQLVGFAALRQVFDHAELLNLAVDPERQQSGIGRKLLLEICRRARDAGAKTVSLEVRSANQAAVRFYRSAGFAAASIRKEYYTHPADDALVMMLDLHEVA